MKTVVALLVAILILTGCDAGHSSDSKSTATLEQKERCSRDARAFAQSEGYVVQVTSHFDAGTGVCLAIINDDRSSSSYVGHSAYDANERRQIAEFGESIKNPTTPVYTCWVADHTGLYRACPSLERYNELLATFYGVVN